MDAADRIAILLLLAGLRRRRRRTILTVHPRQGIVPTLPQRCRAAQHVVVVVAAVVSRGLWTRAVKDIIKAGARKDSSGGLMR